MQRMAGNLADGAPLYACSADYVCEVVVLEIRKAAKPWVAASSVSC
jgi:hypothetical protein